ncbi:hypothetical protein D3C81_1342660 [compost metagenome]|jgi:hypothetical protein
MNAGAGARHLSTLSPLPWAEAQGNRPQLGQLIPSIQGIRPHLAFSHDWVSHITRHLATLRSLVSLEHGIRPYLRKHGP